VPNTAFPGGAVVVGGKNVDVVVAAAGSPVVDGCAVTGGGTSCTTGVLVTGMDTSSTSYLFSDTWSVISSGNGIEEVKLLMSAFARLYIESPIFINVRPKFLRPV
jgi:hypothetical protein